MRLIDEQRRTSCAPNERSTEPCETPLGRLVSAIMCRTCSAITRKPSTGQSSAVLPTPLSPSLPITPCAAASRQPEQVSRSSPVTPYTASSAHWLITLLPVPSGSAMTPTDRLLRREPANPDCAGLVGHKRISPTGTSIPTIRSGQSFQVLGHCYCFWIARTDAPAGTGLRQLSKTVGQPVQLLDRPGKSSPT